jgi:hypothetical protein
VFDADHEVTALGYGRSSATDWRRAVSAALDHRIDTTNADLELRRMRRRLAADGIRLPDGVDAGLIRVETIGLPWPHWILGTISANI